MRDEWILDVLTDLRQFADANNLPLLAEQLDDTAIIATAEITTRDERASQRIHEDEHRDRIRPGGLRAS